MFNYLNEERVRELLSVTREKRLEQLELDFEQLDSFLSLSARGDVYYYNIENNIPDKYYTDLLKYKDNNNEIIVCAQSFFYEQGFLDCVRLVRMLVTGDMK